MPDYTNSKGLPPDVDGNPGRQYPENSTATPWGRLEPLLTPEQLKTRYLFGIPLVSRYKDPETNKPFKLTNDMLKDYIVLAVNQAEAELGLDIMPVKYNEKQPFDLQAYNSYGYMRLQHRPVASLDRFAVMPANNQEVVSIPLDWVETANMVHGQLNIVPLQVAQNSSIGTSTMAPGGSVFLNVLAGVPWVPAYWSIQYTTGFPDGLVPTIVNELIGTISAIKVLSQLAATNARATSTSLGLDGLSQSVGTPGPQIYKQRIDELTAERALLVKKLKKIFGSKFVVGEI